MGQAQGGTGRRGRGEQRRTPVWCCISPETHASHPSSHGSRPLVLYKSTCDFVFLVFLYDDNACVSVLPTNLELHVKHRRGTRVCEQQRSTYMNENAPRAYAQEETPTARKGIGGQPPQQQSLHKTCCTLLLFAKMAYLATQVLILCPRVLQRDKSLSKIAKREGGVPCSSWVVREIEGKKLTHVECTLVSLSSIRHR